MTCQICHADTDNIDPISSDIFPICVPCIDAKVIEIAERKAKEEEGNKDNYEIEYITT